jgi:signal transduction histidine kinase
MRGLRRVAPRLVAASAGVGAAAGALAVARGSGRFTTYAGTSGLGEALTLGAALALVAAGIAVTAGRSVPLIGDLSLGAAITWLAPVAVAWRDGPALVRSVAAALAALTFPLLVHVVCAYPSGRLGSRVARVVVVVAYAEGVAAATLLALFRAPYLDPSCWANCSVNSFLVESLPALTHRVEVVDRWSVAAVAVAFTAICIASLGTASRVARRRTAVVLVPAVVFGAAVAARAVALPPSAVEDPSDTALASIFAVGASAVILVAAGVVLGTLRSGAERRAVANVVANLDEAPAPGTLQAALGAALSDPDLRIAYKVPGRDRYVDADGRPLAASMGRRASTRLTRNGRTIALIAHTSGADDLETRLGPSFLLGLENERLQAEVLAQLDELRASRARIVEMGDGERRRLERDLHDGAQQRLLALTYDLRLARAAPGADIERLDRAIEQTQAALDELRTLAHGIYPKILDEAGLGPALATFADTSQPSLGVTCTDGRRYPSAVETAAYLVVVDAVDDARRRGARHAHVTVVERAGRLAVTVTDDAAEQPPPSEAVADRVGALGGSIVSGGSELRVEIPCA